jgi:hypothetical protein
MARTFASAPALLCVAAFLTARAESAQSLTVSPHHPLSGDALAGLATGDQAAPSIARGAEGWLVAWADRRAMLFSNASPESAQDIFAVRLDAAGQRIESVPLALSLAPGADTDPLVAWNGSNWLVAWKAKPATNAPWNSALVGVRVSASGQRLDSTPLTLLAYSFSEIGGTAIASDGANWVVAAQGTSGGSANLRAARVSAAGIVLDSTPVTLLPEGPLMTFELAYAQGSFLLVWSRYSGSSEDVAGRRFSSALAWQDPAPIAIGATPYDDVAPQVGSNGAQFLVAWKRSWGSPWGDVQAARVSAGGQVLDAAPLELSPVHAYGDGPSSAPAWDGANWYVAWNENGTRLGRISAAGVVLDVGGFAADSSANSTLLAPQLSGNPAGGVQLAWTDDRAGSYEGLDVYTARVLGPAGAGAQVGISSGASAQVAADLARGGANSLLVFRSETSGARRVLATRLDSLGNSLDLEPIEVASGLLVDKPTVGWDGSVYLIAWEDGASASILARRMSSAGAWLDAAPTDIGVGTSPEVAGLNGEFLIAYTRAVSFPLQQFPNYVRVSGGDGAVLGPPVVLNSNYAIEPDVCVVGGRWLVVWQRNYWNNDPHCDVNASFVDSNGVASTPFWVAGGFNTYNHSVSVASSGNQALITWVWGAASNLTRRIHSRRIADDGTFLDASPVPICAASNAEQFHPTAGWNGSEYLVAWQDLRAATSPIDERSDLYCARVTPQGVNLDPAGVALEATAVSEVGPALLGLGAGRALLANSRFESSAPHAAYRIVLRTLDTGCPQPTVYCTAKLTSIGSLPSVGFAGSASVSGGNLELRLQGGLPNVNAVYFHGFAAAAAPFAGGWRCVALPLARHPVAALDANGAASTALSLSAGLIGQTRYYQWWLRDPQHPDGTRVALSNALAVTYCP